MFWKRITVAEHERAVLTKNGEFGGIFAPGSYTVMLSPDADLLIETYTLREAMFESAWVDYLVENRPEVVARYFVCVETTDVEIAMIYLNGELCEVLPPAKRLLLWRDAGEVTFEVVAVIGSPEKGCSHAVIQKTRLGADDLAFVNFDRVHTGETIRRKGLSLIGCRRE